MLCYYYYDYKLYIYYTDSIDTNYIYVCTAHSIQYRCANTNGILS